MGKLEELSAGTSLAHEQLANDEINVHIFFASVATQYYLEKDMLNMGVSFPFFIIKYKDIQLSISQRAFINSIIKNKSFNSMILEMKSLYIKSNNKLSPSDIFLNSIQKGFLIRQIFQHTEQVLSKYKFILNYKDVSFKEINIDELYKKIESFDISQQILICTYVFSNIADNFQDKNKSILNSFIENTEKTLNHLNVQNKTSTLEYKTIKSYLNEL